MYVMKMEMQKLEFLRKMSIKIEYQQNIFK